MLQEKFFYDQVFFLKSIHLLNGIKILNMNNSCVLLLGKIPWKRKWQPTLVLLPRKLHGWRSLVGYSPWGRRVGHDWVTSLSFTLHHQVWFTIRTHLTEVFSGGWVSKESACNALDAGDAGSSLGLGRSPGGGHVSPFYYSCLENPMDRRAWWATVHRVAKRHKWSD